MDSQGLRGHPCGKAHKDVVLLWGVWRSLGEAITITLAGALHRHLPVASTREGTRPSGTASFNLCLVEA